MISFMLDSDINLHRSVKWDDVASRVKNEQSVYIDIVSPEKDDIDNLGSLFHFHPTNLEDCTYFLENPKLEEHREYVFTVVHSFVSKSSIYESYDVHIFLGKHYIITVHDAELEVVEEALGRMMNGNEVKQLKCEYVYYTILDSIVDSYFPILNYWSERIDDIEENIFNTVSVGDPVNSIISIRKELIKLKRIMMPQREILHKLSHTTVNFISEATRIYLQDVFDHIVDTYNTIEEHRDILSNLTDAHFSKTSADMNEVMKRLTVISTIFMPLTFIAGVYGMNFHYMPELEWRYGYFAVMLLMLSIAGGLIVYFKKKKWF